MHIDAITVSIDYSDYLEKIICNKDKVSRWLIITHHSDAKTIELCKKYDLEYFLSKEIYSNGAPFAKSRAINEALQYINPHDWIAIIDSDTQLPNDFNDIIISHVKCKDTIYGCHRYVPNGLSKVENFPFSGEGRPWGFFQLWHSSVINDYYVGEYTNAEGDVQQAARFQKYKMLPLKVTDHQTESGRRHNWYGRGAIGKIRHKIYGAN